MHKKPVFNYHDMNHKPSWKIGHDGPAIGSLEIRAGNKDYTFIEFNITEADLSGKKTVTKDAYITLHDKDAKELYKYLKRFFG
jgi:hypothetical protein